MMTSIIYTAGKSEVMGLRIACSKHKQQEEENE